MAHDPISDLKRYAAALEAQVSGERSRHAARAALHAPGPKRAPRRTVVAIAATLLMGVSNVALASVADPAVPGDALYGVDRAYERVAVLFGSNDTHASERASEALELLARGKSAETLDFVQETLTDLLSSDDPVAAVEEFTRGLGNDEAFRTIVEAASGVNTTGREVAELAREIVKSIDLPQQSDNSSRPETVPGHDDTPGPPEDNGNRADPPGPPTDKGPENPPTSPVDPGQGNPGNTGRNGG